VRRAVGEAVRAALGPDVGLAVAAQVEFGSKLWKQTLKAVHHILVSTAQFQALSTRVHRFNLRRPTLPTTARRESNDAVDRSSGGSNVIRLDPGPVVASAPPGVVLDVPVDQGHSEQALKLRSEDDSHSG